MNPACTNCKAPLTFVGEIAAPGSGQSWECERCGHTFVRIGTTLIDNEDMEPQGTDNGPRG